MENERKNEFIRKAKLIHEDTYDYSNVLYINAKTKIDISCKIHGLFLQTPDTHLKGSGCPKCAKERVDKSKIVSKEDFLIRAKEIHGDKYDYSKIEYTMASDKIEIVCRKHGSFYQRGVEHLNNKGCIKCGRESAKLKINKGLDYFIKKSKEIHGGKYDYSNSVYTKSADLINITCKLHGNFTQSAISHMRGSGCYECGRNKTLKSKIKDTEYFINKANEVHNNKYDYSESVYERCKDKIKIKCTLHGDFEQIARNHTQGKGCPKCITNCSKNEIEIRDFLSNYINSEYSNRTILDNKEIDIFIPDKNIGIEYNGTYWHSDKKKEINHLLNKSLLAKSKDVKLIHVFEDEWLLKKEIVKSRLLSILGLSKDKIYARKTIVKEISSSESMTFLENNHLQGALGAKIRLGLYYKDELVSVMTFGQLRKNLGNNKKEDCYELLRFCNKLNTNIIGGASKLLKFFEDNFKYEELISYSDRRWGEGDLYRTLNFELVSTSKPNYFYSKGTYRENRFKYRKDILVSEGFDINKTEKQIMEERGYFRIYDCGTHKFTKRK